MLLVLVIFPCGLVQAWNDRGHMLVALLTYRQLPEVTRGKVKEIIRQHPHYELFLTQNRPSGLTPEEWAFVRAATWPDFVRGMEHRAEFHRSRWHFINIPFVPPGEAEHLTGPKFVTPIPNVIFSIAECRDVLSESYPAPARKAIHLAWLEHLVGDVHQPLHCVTLVNRVYPNGDLGGNLLAVRTGSVVKRLHGYWDDALGSDTEYASLLATVQEIEAAPELARSALPQIVEHPDPAAWTEEGHLLAKQFAYLDGSLPFADYKAFETGMLPADQIPLLPADYEAQARTLARQQAAIAAHRLADVLIAATAPSS